MEPPSIISVRKLSKKFDGVNAVDDLNLEIAPGEIFGLVGPDGAGKTTTLRLICGLLDPTQGEIFVAGHDVARETGAVKDQIGYMAQRFGLYVDLTVEENMNFYADLFGVVGQDRDALKMRLLQMTRMEPFRARAAGKLSGGMKQKLALMCSLLHHPRVLFLDEPTNGVDPVSRRDFWTILYELVKGGLTVFITTAYLDEAERCHRVGLMHHGRLIECDTPAALKNSLDQVCYEVTAADRHAARETLAAQPGVTSVEPYGPVLHLFLNPGETSPERLAEEAKGITMRPIAPSLEDVFIALIRRQEAMHA